MAEIRIDIKTIGHLQALDELQKKLENLRKTALDMNKLVRDTAKVTAALQGTAKAATAVSTAVGKTNQAVQKNVQAVKAATLSNQNLANSMKRMSTMSQTVNAAIQRQAQNATRLRSAEQSLVGANQALAASVAERTAAEQRYARARRDLKQAEKGGDANAIMRASREFENAQAIRTAALQRYELALTHSKNATKEFNQAQTAMRASGQEMSGIIGSLKQYRALASDLGKQALAEGAQEAADDFKRLEATLKTLQNSATRAFGGINKELTRVQSGAQISSRTFGNLRAAIQPVVTVMNNTRSVLQAVLAPINRTINAIGQLAGAFAKLASGVGRGALSGVQVAFKGMGSAASAMYAILQRTLQGSIGLLHRFSMAVTTHMQRSAQAMRTFYNAGWSLMMSGYSMKNFGDMIFGGMGGSLEQFMEYEKALTRTAISASTENKVIQDLIFGLQRGTIGGAPIKAYSAEELAEGLYFYTSAIGKEITGDPEQMTAVGNVVGEIMRVASATRTSLETVTKGVINIATEFGIDPRLDENADAMVKIAQQVAFLSNVSTMEVPDIFETFKYIGPMGHILTDRDTPGAGLEEMMALTFFASEVGLRGGNTGRAIGQALQTLLNPSGPAVQAASEAFGIGASEEAFRAFFFNAEGELRGGLPGLFEKLERIPQADAARFISAIFTTNATRSVAGIMAAIDQKGGLSAIIDETLKLQGEAPAQFMARAFAQTNDTIFANWQYLQNAWFQVTAEIIASIEGPLKRALSGLAEIFFDVADVIKNNRWIGEVVIGFLAVVAAITTAIGSFFMLGGAVLLTMKAFSLLGGLIGPSIFFFASVIQALAILTPLFIGLAAAVVLIHKAWDENLYGIQERVNGFVESLQEGFEWISQNGAIAARALHEVFSRRVVRALQEVQKWMTENAETVNMYREAVEALVRGFVGGLLGTLISVVNGLMAFGRAVIAAIRYIIDITEEITGFNITLENTATIVGVTLGAVFGIFLARHLLPMGLAVSALQRGIGLLSMAFTGLQIAVSGVITIFRTLGTVIGAVGSALAGTGVAATIVGSVVTVGVLAAAGAFIYLAAKSEEFRQDVMLIGTTVFNALRPFFTYIATIAVAGFVLVSEIVRRTTEYFADHTAELERMAKMVGIVLVGAFALFVVAVVAAVAAVALLAIGISKLFEDGDLLANFIDDVAADMQVLFEYLTLEHINWAAVGTLLSARMAQYGLELGAALTRAIGTAVATGFGAFSDWVDSQGVLVRTFVQQNPFSAPIYELGKHAESSLLSFTDTVANGIEDQADVWGGLADGTNIFMQREIDAIKPPNVTAGSPLEAALNEVFTGDRSPVELVQDIIGGLSEGSNLQTVMDGLLNVEGLNTSEYNTVFNEIAKMTQDTTDDVIASYQSAITKWEEFKTLVDSVGMGRATEIFHQRGIPIPIDPRSFPEYQTQYDAQEAIKEAENIARQSRINWRKMNEEILTALMDADLETLMKGQFGQEWFNQSESMLSDSLQGGFGVSAAQAMTTGISDTLLTNISEAMPWMNPAELFADLAGFGVADDNVAGVNMHKVLRPLIERWAQESGLAVEDILKDVPKFFAPEEFQALGLAELTGSLSQIRAMYGQAVYDQLDLLGTEFDPRTGRVYEEHGIDWQEVIDFGISRSMAGAGNLDWNLTDYIMSAWDITRGQAEAYIAQNQLDPNIINQDTFDDIQMAINAQGGKVNVMTNQAWKWFNEQTQNGVDKSIEISQEAFDRLDDATKMGLSAMGYTFIIGGKQTQENLLSNAKMIKNTIEDEYGDIPSAFERAIRDGMATETFFTDPTTGEEWVTAAFGDMEVTMPAADYEQYKETVNEIKRITDELNAKRKELEEPITLGDVVKPVTSENYSWMPNIWGRDNFVEDQMPNTDPAYNAGVDAGTQMKSGIDASPLMILSGYNTTVFSSYGNLAARDFIKSYESTVNQSSITRPIMKQNPRLTGDESNTRTGGVKFIDVQPKADLDIEPYLQKWQTAFTAGDALDKKVFIADLDADPLMFNTAMTSVLRFGNTFNLRTFTADLDANSAPFFLKWQAAYNAGTTFDNAIFTATIDADATQFWLAINSIPTVVARRYIDVQRREVAGGAIPGLAKGGPVSTNNPYVIGEEGPELFLPTASGTIIPNETLSALASGVSPIASNEFRSARQWEVKGNVNTGSMTEIHVDQVIIEKDVDITKQLDRLDRATGKKQELIRRGMGDFNNTRLY